MSEYLALFIFAVLAAVFVAGSYAASRLVASRRPSAAKSAPYECGIVPTRDKSERFPVRFFLVAMVFIVFDIEIIFLYPWAVRFDALGAFGLVEMVLFSVVVFICLAYLLSSGALDWGPRRSRTNESGTSSVRRVHKPAVDAAKSDTNEVNSGS